MGFCGMLDHRTGRADFSLLRKMSGLYGAGCAFIDGEFGIICSGADSIQGDDRQPVTIKYNNFLYTAAIICDTFDSQSGSAAQGVLEGYVEEGERFVRGLDFPYAIALYDGRCGELMLVKSSIGDKPLFYTVIDGAVFFASSIRSVVRLFGGCVRVSKQILEEHIFGEPSGLRDGLFCDIKALRAGQSLICSRLGDTLIDTDDETYRQNNEIFATQTAVKMTEIEDIRRCLSEALFAFDYPQFDYFMPYLAIAAKAAKEVGEHSLKVYDPTESVASKYTAERAERIGAMAGVRLCSVPTEYERKNTRMLKKMESRLDEILSEYLEDPLCIIHKLTDGNKLSAIDDEKSIPLRIRRKGMLCQCAMWFESYNLVLV